MSGAPEFIEDFDGGAHVDPLDAKEQDFDWDAVFAAVDGIKKPLDDEQGEKLHAGMRAFLSALVEPYSKAHGDKVERLEHIQAILGRRVIAFVWAVNPALIAGAPSLSAIAKQFGVKSRDSMSMHAADARRRWGLRNRASDHAWNFKEKADAPPSQVTKTELVTGGEDEDG